jgi:hypothetical protein
MVTKLGKLKKEGGDHIGKGKGVWDNFGGFKGGKYLVLIFALTSI